MENVNDLEEHIILIEENISQLRLHIDNCHLDDSIDECFGCNTVEEAKNAIDILEAFWHKLKQFEIDLLKGKSE